MLPSLPHLLILFRQPISLSNLRILIIGIRLIIPLKCSFTIADIAAIYFFSHVLYVVSVILGVVGLLLYRIGVRVKIELSGVLLT